ncbi:MAG: hypothetical protein ACI35W_02700 [Anaeroplasmataceae bacterium]
MKKNKLWIYATAIIAGAAIVGLSVGLFDNKSDSDTSNTSTSDNTAFINMIDSLQDQINNLEKENNELKELIDVQETALYQWTFNISDTYVSLYSNDVAGFTDSESVNSIINEFSGEIISDVGVALNDDLYRRLCDTHFIDNMVTLVSDYVGTVYSYSLNDGFFFEVNSFASGNSPQTYFSLSWKNLGNDNYSLTNFYNDGGAYEVYLSINRII